MKKDRFTGYGLLTLSKRCLERRWLVPCLYVILACLVTSCQQDKPKKIRIGLSINLSGYSGSPGEDIRDGAILAVKEINRHQTSRKLELIVKDDRNTPEGVKKADKELIRAGCDVIIGHSHSQNTLVAYPLVTGAGRILITAYTATSKLSKIDDLFLRTSVDNFLYARSFAKLFRTRQIKNILLVLDLSNPSFSKDLSDKLRKHFGNEIKEAYINTQKGVNWPLVVKQILRAMPDGVFMITEVKSTAILSQMLREAGYNGRFFATIWAQGPYLAIYGGKAVEGMEIVSFIRSRYDNVFYEKFEQELKRQFSKRASPKSARAYELIYILADAMNRCGNKADNPVCIKDKLISGNYNFLLGRVRFDRFGDVQRPIFSLKMVKGHFKLVQRLF